jgi:glucose/arabinose dehydrogenase
MLPIAGVPRRGRLAAALGLGILLGVASSSGANPTPAPTRTPAPVRTPAAPLTTSSVYVNAGAVSDVAVLKLAEKVGPITSIANAGDTRLFLTLRSGRVVIWNGTRVLRRAFLDLSDRVSGSGPRGLLSLAFDPRYASNGLFFVAYTDKAGNLVIARYRRSGTRKNRADPKSGVPLMTIPFPPDSDHYGGQLQFGPDGFLYAGIGDGTTAARPSDSAQRDDVLLGKILRLDVDARHATPPYYGIPPSNPFVGPDPPLDEVWSRGLRDPWRFSFDWLTGDLYIADVGKGAPQEIDFQMASSAGGEDYGWPALPAGSSDFRPTILAYSGRDTCAVIGGYVYRGSRDPRLAGVYFYGDYCTGFVWARGQVTNVVIPKLTTFGEDSAGELYAGTETGSLYRLTSTFPSLAGPAPQREKPVNSYEPASPAFEPFFKSEPAEASPPVGTFQPPRIESPFAPPPPVYAPDSSQDAPLPEEPAAQDQTSPDQPSAPAPEHNIGPDRLPPAPPPEHPTPRVVEPHG